MATAITGAQVYVQYGKEAVAYGTEAVTIASAFGSDIRITIEPRNNVIKVYGLNSRNAQTLLLGQFEGMATIEGMLGTTHWIAAGIGSSASTSSNPYVHTYTEANTLPSITIEKGADLDTDSVRKLLGCKLEEFTISGSVGEPIRFRQTWFYKTETEGTSLDGTPASDSETPFTFAEASVERPDATTLVNVQRFEYTQRNNLLRTYGLGSRFNTQLLGGQREHIFTFDRPFESSSELEQFYGSATAPAATQAETSLDINITNGLASSSERHLQITLTGVKFDTHSDPVRPNELCVETIGGNGRTVSIIGQDNTGTTIFD